MLQIPSFHRRRCFDDVEIGFWGFSKDFISCSDFVAPEVGLEADGFSGNDPIQLSGVAVVKHMDF